MKEIGTNPVGSTKMEELEEKENAALHAQCTELRCAVERYRDELNKAKLENEQLRQEIGARIRELSYLTGVKDTVELFYGRNFNGLCKRKIDKVGD